MLQARFLGDRRYFIGDQEIPKLIKRKAGKLLAFLMINAGKRFTREELVEIIWDTPPSNSSAAISHELWVLRNALNITGLNFEDYIDKDGPSVLFRRESTYRLDVHEFEAAIKSAQQPSSDLNAVLMRWEFAASLYTGTLLPELYDNWCHFSREALRDQYLLTLENILDYQERGEAWDAAINTAKKLIHANPLLEYVHRSLMRCYFAKGSRASALRQFEICQTMLTEEFEMPVQPMTETIDLRNDILEKPNTLVRKPPEFQNRPTSRTKFLSEDSLSVLETAQASLHSAYRQIDKIVRSQRNS